MTSYDNARAHQALCEEIHDLYVCKNQDYGDSFHQTWEEEGFAMARIRLSDKLSRFKQLSKGNPQLVKDENLRDTLIDLANYAMMTVMEIDRMSDDGICVRVKDVKKDVEKNLNPHMIILETFAFRAAAENTLSKIISKFNEQNYFISMQDVHLIIPDMNIDPKYMRVGFDNITSFKIIENFDNLYDLICCVHD